MSWPERIADVAPACDWTKAATWSFEPLDETVFGAVHLARQVGLAGLTYPAVYNAANEQAVEAFHSGRIGFNQIVELIERVVDAHEPQSQLTLESVLSAETWARDRADTQIATAC
jgi:1-deoxy-D-xylulose-5-phosphate reductoisomerase